MASAGLIARKSRRSVSRAISPMRARQLDAGRPAADDHERHPLAPPVRIGFPFRGLERDEDALADLQGVLEGLEARRHGLPLVVPEVRVVGAGGDDQRVVFDRPAVGQDHPPALDVQVDRLAEDHRRVALLAQHRAQRLRDLARRQGARRHLVEHRLEQVEVAPVDERDRHLRVVAEAARRVQPAEPAADDDRRGVADEPPRRLDRHLADSSAHGGRASGVLRRRGGSSLIRLIDSAAPARTARRRRTAGALPGPTATGSRPLALMAGLGPTRRRRRAGRAAFCRARRAGVGTVGSTRGQTAGARIDQLELGLVQFPVASIAIRGSQLVGGATPGTDPKGVDLTQRDTGWISA